MMDKPFAVVSEEESRLRVGQQVHKKKADKKNPE
jgi:hypothetical protein